MGVISITVLEFTSIRSKLHLQSVHNWYAYRLQSLSFAYHCFAVSLDPAQAESIRRSDTVLCVNDDSQHTTRSLSSFWYTYFWNYKDDVKAADLLLKEIKRHFKISVVTRWSLGNVEQQ